MADEKGLVLSEEQVRQKIEQVKEQAKAIQVRNAEEFEAAGNFMKRLKEQMDWIEKTYWGPSIKQAHDLHKSLVAKREEMLDMLRPLYSQSNNKMVEWRRAEDKKRRDAEIKLQADAKKKADEEALKKAEKLEAQGRPEEAAAVVEHAANNPPPVVLQSNVPKVSGVSFRKTWQFKITNPALVKDEFKTIDESKIGKTVRALGKDSEKMIGGIEVWQEESAAVGGGR